MADCARVFEASSPDGQIRLYLSALDFVEHGARVDPIEGVLMVSPTLEERRRVFGRVTCSMRYGCDAMELLGLSFEEDVVLAAEQMYPRLTADTEPTQLQRLLLRRLGPRATPFSFCLPLQSPSTVALCPNDGEESNFCGVTYTLSASAADDEWEQPFKSSTALVTIRKLQGSPARVLAPPCLSVSRRFMLSPGELHLQASLDKQVYHRGERLILDIHISNSSSRSVRRIKATLLQTVQVRLYTNSVHRTAVGDVQIEEKCPVTPGQRLQKTLALQLAPKSDAKTRKNLALNGALPDQPDGLASTTQLSHPDQKVFGLAVSYSVKIKLYLSSLAGRVVAEMPFTLTHMQSDLRRLCSPLPAVPSPELSTPSPEPRAVRPAAVLGPQRSRTMSSGRPRHRGRHGNYERRHVESATPQAASADAAESSSPVVQMFREFATHLDNKHDRYERLVKKSRDVTIESKRIIFMLHRVSKDEQSAALLEEAAQRFRHLENTALREIAQELRGQDPEVHLYHLLQAEESAVRIVTEECSGAMREEARYGPTTA
ncbi:phosrestin-2-like [Pollicipes pollicipes]|uniref:phosrestin-2-like n=1 Tax=Pollicipes pollicipes TaxID=41117 RepID=UPI001884D91F|nr:phosrestin-2-like [Pollicipes pollicipes]